MTGHRGEPDLLDLIAEGATLLEAERSVLLSGAFARLPALTGAKRNLLARLESAIPGTRGTPKLRADLAHLVAESRRNERLLLGAREGIVAARRRLQAIEAARRGDVAYLADGSRVVSREDAAQRTRRA